MEIVVEFKRRMEVCSGEAMALRNRERERVDSPCGDHSPIIAFTQLKTRCAIRGNIQVGPAMGGARNTIFQEQPADCVQVLRAIKPQLLLLQVVVSNATTSSTQVWTMSVPGASIQVLTPLTSSLPGVSNQSYALNETSQFPWSNVSRDGSTYALQEIDSSNHTQSIVIASLNGGKPTPIATTSPGASSVSLSGWTTM